MVQSLNLKKSVRLHSSKICALVGPLTHNFNSESFFSYSEYIWKNDIVDNDEEDTMEFDIWKRYVFRPDLSNGLTGDEVITTLHPGN